MPSVLQQSMVLISRIQAPYFQYQQHTLQYTDQNVLAQVLFFSVDPVMKVWLSGASTNFRKTKIGSIFNCFGLAKIIQGNNDYQKGAYYFGNTGTTNYVIIDQDKSKEIFPVPQELVNMYSEENFLYLINNGLAAYAGYQILSPTLNQSVLVSTAAGATGNLLCQLLKKKGHKVIGLSSQHKLQFIKKFADVAVDYRDTFTLKKILKETKFSCYFDNVGESLLDLVLEHIQKNGRIALCGATSNYQSYERRGITNSMKIIEKRVKMEGLTFYGMIPKIHQSTNHSSYHIFAQYQGVQLYIQLIGMKEFPSKFAELLTSGSQVRGKFIVKLNK